MGDKKFSYVIEVSPKIYTCEACDATCGPDDEYWDWKPQSGAINTMEDLLQALFCRLITNGVLCKKCCSKKTSQEKPYQLMAL